MNLAQTLRDQLIQDIQRRIFEESYPRIKQCLAQLNEEQLHFRPNDNSNSVAMLVVHLCGNARQWIVSGLGGQPDNRNRDREFDPTRRHTASSLLRELADVKHAVTGVLATLTAEKLSEPVVIQGFQENGCSAVLHVVEHYSYHVGQITYITKQLLDIDTAYYGNRDLNK